MLQTLLQILLPVLQNAAAVIIPLAMLLAFIAKRPDALTKWFWWGVNLGVVSSFIVTILKLTSIMRNREVFEGWVLLLALAAEVLTLFYCWRARKRGYPDQMAGIPGWTVFLLPVALILYRGLDFFLFSSKFVLPQAELVWTEFFLQMGGVLLGLIVAVLTGLAIFRVALVLPVRDLLTGIAAGFTAIMAQQAVILIQVLLARGILPMNKGLLAVVIPLINHGNWFFYALLAVTLSLPLFLFWQRRPAKVAGLNPAQYRKLAATARRQLRWAAAAAASLALVFFLATAGKAYADQKVELSPAIPVLAQKGEVNVPLDTVADGKLHRFSYTASNGTVMRFIIIKKSGSAYGVGLDACDICGPTGYYERDGQVVCKLCDVVMNKATIGFKGGCNPVPITYKIAGGKIVIPAEALEKEKKRFR
jgi:uncharacterized membrane protein